LHSTAFVPASDDESLFAAARVARTQSAMDDVLFRGVIEYTNRCYRNCTYCGIRAKNTELKRYALTRNSILTQAEKIAEDDLPVVSLQAADHLKYDFKGLAQAVTYITQELKRRVLLVIGDIPFEHYERLYDAGAREAIVKFETSNAALYETLRPHNTLRDRLNLIENLAKLGYEVSSGFIYGLPGTSPEDVKQDLALIRNLPLFAASVSPFIPNDQAPLKAEHSADLEGTLRAIAQIRLDNPHFRIPAVSALNLLAPEHETIPNYGQYLGLQAGANIITVNYTPPVYKKDYVIYETDRHIVQLAQAKEVVRLAGGNE
jgi:biotin synthase